MPEKKKSNKVQKEQSFEIGMDEAWKANLKRLFEEFLQESLNDIRETGLLFDRMMLDNHAHIVRVQNYSEIALKDAIAHSKNVDSRTAIHLPVHDMAQDRMWNFIDELSASLSAKTGVEQDAIMTLLTKVVADVLAPSITKAAEVKK